MLNKCLCIADSIVTDNNSNDIKVLISVYIIINVITLFLIHFYNTSIALNHLCCLWCNKVIIIKLSNICNVKKNIHCKCCHKKHKSCKSICKALRKHCNILIFNRFSLSSICKSIDFLLLLMLLSMRKLLSLCCLSVRRNILR